ELYRRRWRIEDAFALTKRVLDLAYLWTGSTNAVQLQIYATLIFYAVLLTICQQVAQVLGEPLERISVEMVFRALYHYRRAAESLGCCPAWFRREASLKAACTGLVNYHHQLPLSPAWGSGVLSSSDGQRFPVSGKTRHARRMPPSLGYGMGVTFYSWSSDQL